MEVFGSAKKVGTIQLDSRLLQVRPKEEILADNSGGVGVMGVLVGALLVLVIGGGLLFATGNFPGHSGNTLKIEVPKPK